MHVTGVEIDMVVRDSRAAYALYEQIFELERIVLTELEQGKNEAIFKIYGNRFHLLDENPEYGLVAPAPETPQSIWCNVLVTDIRKTWQNAMEAGCTEIYPVTEVPDMALSNAMFRDPFGYMWMLHQIYKDMSFEERIRVMEQMD